jgi:hypothetical protein
MMDVWELIGAIDWKWMGGLMRLFVDLGTN